jgi:hypothetical protein
MSARGRAAVRWGAHLVAVAVAAWAIARALGATQHDVNLLGWLLAGAVLHDLVVLPAYTLADRVVAQRVRAVNHVRVPALISLVLLLVYAPSIFGRNTGNFARVSGRPMATDPLAAWLWITLGLFVASGLVLLVRRTGGRRRRAA